jgi:hypothetical protein
VTSYESCDLTPIVGAPVTLPGGASTVTDAAGHFAFSNLPTGSRVLVSIGSPTDSTGVGNYSSTQVVADVLPGQTTTVTARLLKGCVETQMDTGATPLSFDSNDCGLSTDGRRVVLQLAGGSLVTPSTGLPFTGNVRAELFPVPFQTVAADGSTDLSGIAAMPGDMSAVEDGGAPAVLESLGPAEIRLRDAVTGEQLQLASGQTAHLLLKAYRDAQSGEPVTSWSYDTATGAWAEGPAGGLEDAGEPLYGVDVPHLSWWNVDAPLSAKTCIQGVVTADGAPLAGAELRAVGSDFGFTSTRTTDSAGHFCVDVKPGAALALLSRGLKSGEFYSAIQPASAPATAGLSCATTPASCGDVGPVVVTAPVLECVQGTAVDNRGLSAPLGNPIQFFATVAVTDDFRRATCAAYVQVGPDVPTDALTGAFCAAVPPLAYTLTGHDPLNKACTYSPQVAVAVADGGVATGPACGADGGATCDGLGELQFYCGS